MILDGKLLDDVNGTFSQVDENAISSLPSNFFINNLLATMALTKDEPAAKKILCDNCDNGDPAQSRCNECGIFLCQFCTESHKRNRSTKAHKLLTLEELKSNAGPQNVAEKLKCPKHKNEVVKLFCKICQTTICRDCTFVDHQGHKYAFVEDIADEEKQHLQRNLDEVKQRKVRVEQGIANLEKFNENLEVKKKSTISEVNEHFDELVRAVEFRRREMVEKATSLTDTKQKQIQGQLEELEVALASCNSSIEFTERALKNGNDVQILSMEKYILQSLGQLRKIKDQTEPCVTEDILFYIPPSVNDTSKKLLRAEYDVHVDVASPENCTASFSETKTPLKLEKWYSIALICKDRSNHRLGYGGHVIKPSFTGVEVSDVAITDNGDGSYIISFVLRQGAVLEFGVSIDGVPAPSCSLTKQVRWVISNVYGKGHVSHGGLTMTGVGSEEEYCCRVGACYFETGVHTWEVQVASYFETSVVEVGIIDYEEVNERVSTTRKKWVEVFLIGDKPVEVVCKLDMDKRTLNITPGGNYRFLARRVSPFFACSSSNTTIRILQRQLFTQ